MIMRSAGVANETQSYSTSYEAGRLPPPPGAGPRQNISETERWVSMLAGAGLALWGLTRRTPLGLGAAALGAVLVYRGTSGHCDVYGALGIDTHERAGPARPRDFYQRGIHVERSVTVNKPAHDLYEFWHNFENLPRFMAHLESVKVLDNKTSHWVARGPAGQRIAWDAQIINDEPDRLIAWRSLREADVENAGSVRFVEAPASRGTEVKVVLDYLPPAGRVGAALAWLFGEEPSQQIAGDLRRFKQVMETGETPTTQGQPSGREG